MKIKRPSHMAQLKLLGAHLHIWASIVQTYIIFFNDNINIAGRNLNILVTGLGEN